MAAKTKKISTLIENQLPGFISSEYENFSKFIEKYYEQLELPGQPLDIINNISRYRDINYYEKNLLNQQTILIETVGVEDNILFVEDATSFPEENGYVRIGDEICFYKSRSDTEFLEVSRGISGNTTLGDLYEKSNFVTTAATSHNSGEVVLNISNLFLYALVKNFEEQYLGAFPEKYLNEEVDKRTLIKNIKKFYQAKGTDRSISFVFNSVVPQNKGESPTVYNPKDYTLKSSTSDWVTKYSLKVKSLSGNLEDLIGEQIIQTTPNYASAVVDNVIYLGKYAEEDLYELVLSPDSVNSEFTIASKTQLTKDLAASLDTGERINVVSTFGWKNKGKLLIGNEQITFDDKNVNQFIIESRLGNISTHLQGTNVYDYFPVNTSKGSFIILGVLYNLNVESPSPYSNSGDKIEISDPGFDTRDPIIYDVLFNKYRWILNDENVSPSIPLNPVLQASVADLLANVSAIYEDEQYYYICSSGFPSHQILLSGVNEQLADQKYLKLIRKYPSTVTEIYPTPSKDTGIFIDGTVAMSYKDEEFINFGKITNIDVVNKGTGYKSAPFVLVNNEPGKAESNLSGEVVESITVKTQEIFEVPPEITITSGRGAILDAIVTQGRITDLVIDNPGEYYSTPPTIRITDRAGRGRFAEYKAIVSFEGKIVDIEKINEGRFYSKANILVEIIPEGRNASANSTIVKWVKNRYEKIKNNLDDSYGYVFRNIDFNKQYGYGRVANPLRLRLLAGDNITNVLDEANIKKHSPILGFAYDGNPIYGPYGFEDPADSDSDITRLNSGYVEKTNRVNGPSIDEYPLGSFIDDYEWIPNIQSGKIFLDKNNGRFCVTPEYPDGTYAYFITINSNNEPEFPYIIGENYYSLPVDSNYNSFISQDDLPQNVKRLRTPQLKFNGGGVIATIEEVTSGSIDSITVLDSPKSFNVGAKVVFNNSGTSGENASAFVSSVHGENIISLRSKNTIAKIDIIENSYLFDGDFIQQIGTNAIGKIVGNVFNEKTVVLEEIQGTFELGNKLFAKDSDGSPVVVLNFILDQNSSYSKDAIITLTDGLNTPTSTIATGRILETTTNQNSIKIKVISGEFVLDQKYFLRSSDLNNTPGSKIVSVFSLSDDLSPFQINNNVALASTDRDHNLAVGDKIIVDITPDDNQTETTYYVRKKAYQTIKLLPLSFSAKIIDTGVGRIDLLNSGAGYTSGSFSGVELIFLNQENSRINVGAEENENNAKANITVIDGRITSIIIVDKGNNYRKGDVLTIRDTALFTLGTTTPAIFFVDHAGVASTETKINLTRVSGLSENDTIKIGNEILTVTAVNLTTNSIDVIRGEFPKDHFNNQEVTIENFVYRFDENYYPLGSTTNDPSVFSYNNNTKELITQYDYSSNSPNPISGSDIFYDNSTPKKLVAVSSVSEVSNKLEFSKDNENNFAINPEIDIQKYYSYKFDTSHFSMTNIFLDFSPSLNENILVEEKFVGEISPGNEGSYIRLKLGFGPLIKSNTFTNKKDLRFANYYYFIVATNVDTDNASLRVINDPFTGEKELLYVTNNKFLYAVDSEPQYQGTGDISYVTDSRFALGKINSVSIDNSGVGYKNIPIISGVYISPVKESIVKPIYDSINGKIVSVEVISGGEGYLNPQVVISNAPSYGARFRVFFENGSVKSIDVLNQGSGFQYLPELKVIEGGVKLYATSNTIGVPKNVRFINNGGGFYNDNSLLSTYRSSYSLILSDFDDYGFSQGEEIVQRRLVDGQFVETVKSRVASNGWRPGSNIIKLENIQGEFDKSLPIIGKSNNKTANIVSILYTEFSPEIKSYFDNLGFYGSDKGKLSSGTQKLTDSFFYQDYSYVVRSKTAIDIWRDLIKQTTHPAGFKLFGELLIESEGKADVPIYQKTAERITTINLSPKSIKFIGTKKNITQNIIKVQNSNIERGIGSVSLEIDNSETLATSIRLDAPFNGNFDSNTGQLIGQTTFTIIDNKTNTPLEIFNAQQLIISLDGVVQEPGIAYTVTNNQITFSTPPLGERIEEGQIVPAQEFFGRSIRFKNSELNNQYLKKVRNIFQRNGIWLDSANQLRFNKNFIVEETIGYLKERYPNENWVRLEQVYKNNIGFVVDALEHDLRFGGNIKTINYAEAYFSDQINLGENDIIKVLDALEYVITLSVASIRNWDVTFVDDGLNNQVIITPDSDIVIVPSTVGIAIGMLISSGSQFPENTKVVEILSNTEVKLNNKAFPDIGETYDPLFVEQESIYVVSSGEDQTFGTIAVEGTLEVGLTGVISSRGSISSVRQITFYFNKINTGTFYDASILIEKNKKYIQEETIGYIQSIYPNLNISDPEKCLRDIGHYIDAVVYHIRYGGNKKIVEFGQSYYDKNRLRYINDKLSESLKAFEYATSLMTSAMRNLLPEGTFTNEISYVDETILEDIDPPACQKVASTLNSYYNSINTILTIGKNLVVITPENEQRTGNWTPIRTYSNYGIIKDVPIFNTECQEVVSSLLILYNSIQDTLLNGANFISRALPDYFNGENTTFDLYYEDGSIVKTDNNENLIVSLSGIIQKVSTNDEYRNNSYYILRSENLNDPDKIVFSEAPKWEQNENAITLQGATAVEKFFAFSVGSYNLYTINVPLSEYVGKGPYVILSDTDGKIGLINNENYVLVFLNGILQEQGKAYNIFGSTIVFSQDVPYYVSESGDKTYSNVSILVFYGRDLDKNAVFHDFEPNTYYNRIELRIDGSNTFEKFISWYNFAGNEYTKNLAQVAFQKDGDTINIIGKIRGHERIDANRWKLIISGNNPIFDSNLSIFLGTNGKFDSSNVIEISNDLVVLANEIFNIPENDDAYYGVVTVEETGTLVVEGTLSSSTFELSFSKDSDGNRIVRRDLPLWLYETDLGDKTWRKVARNYGNLIEGDLIKIDGENDYREIIKLPEIVKSKQFNDGENVSNNVYGTIKVTNYNDITRGEGLSIRAIIVDGKVNKLVWNRRDLNLYFNNGVLLQPTAYQYYTPPIIEFIPENDTGGGARAEVIAVGGQVIDIVLLDGGSGYTIPPKVIVARGYNKIKKSGRKIDSVHILNVQPEALDAYSKLTGSSIVDIVLDKPGIESITSELFVTPFDTNKVITKIISPEPPVFKTIFDSNISVAILPKINIITSVISTSRVLTTNVETRYDVVSSTTIQSADREIIVRPKIVITDAILKNALPTVNDRGAFLDIDLSETDTIVYIANTFGFPDTGRLLIGKEIVFYSRKLTDRFLDVLRGQSGTIATTHNAGDYLRLIPDTISIVPTNIINVFSVSSITEIHNTSVEVVTTRSTIAENVQKFDPQRDDIEFTREFRIEILPTIDDVKKEIVTICLPSYENITVSHFTSSENKVDVNSVESVSSNVVSINSTDTLIENTLKIDVDRSDTIISTQITASYYNEFETVIQSKFELTYNKTEILSIGEINVNSEIFAVSSLIEIVQYGVEYAISSATNTINNVVKEIVSIVPIGDYLITKTHFTTSESKIDVNSVESVSSNFVSINSTDTLIENTLRIDVDRSDAIISTQITASYYNEFETVIQSKFELTHNKTEIVNVEKIDINSEIIATSAIITLVQHGANYTISSTTNTIQNTFKEIVNILPTNNYSITPIHYTNTESNIEINSIDSISSNVVTLVDSVQQIIINNKTGFIDQPGTSDVYEIFTLGNTIGSYDVFKFDDVGVAGVNEMTLGMFDLYYPFMTIVDFEERKNSNFAISGDKFNLTFPSINEFGAILSSDIDQFDTTIFVDGTSGFPNSGYLYIGNEIIFYSGKTSNSFTNITREVRNTAAQSHLEGSYIRSLN
jgi:hypothetical protein